MVLTLLEPTLNSRSASISNKGVVVDISQMNQVGSLW